MRTRHRAARARVLRGRHGRCASATGTTAFATYAAAARDFDRFAPGRAAAARHAMGELAYRQFKRYREAAALADQALRDFGPQSDAGLRSAIASLKAKAVLGAGNRDAKPFASTCRRCCSESEDLANAGSLRQARDPATRHHARIHGVRRRSVRGLGAYFEQAAARCEASATGSAMRVRGRTSERWQKRRATTRSRCRRTRMPCAAWTPDRSRTGGRHLGQSRPIAEHRRPDHCRASSLAGQTQCDSTRRSPIATVRAARWCASAGCWLRSAASRTRSSIWSAAPRSTVATLFKRIDLDARARADGRGCPGAAAETDMRSAVGIRSVPARSVCAAPRDPAIVVGGRQVRRVPRVAFAER